ncbi:hypothetical protein MASR2M78_31300 [Treponema sp.]
MNKDSVSPELFGTLIDLTKIEELRTALLGGGTSLALLSKPMIMDSISSLFLPDMATMKINAITNRVSKKDFTDLLLLHVNQIEITKALEYFCEKFGAAGRFLAIRSLTYLDDAKEEPDPQFTNGWTWEYVRSRMQNICQELINYDRH